MTDPIRTCLTYLRNHTIDDAIRHDLIPIDPAVTLINRLFGQARAIRVSAFAEAVLERGVAHLEDADIPALRKVHNFIEVLHQRDRIFQICLQVFLKNVLPGFTLREAEEITARTTLVARPNILEVMELVRREDHTQEDLEDLVEIFRSTTPEEQSSIIVDLKRIYNTFLRRGTAIPTVTATSTFLHNPALVHQLHIRNDARHVRLNPPLQNVDGTAFSMSVQPLLDKASEIKRTITFDQLPREVNAHTLRNFFQSLDRRLEALSPAAKQRALEEINGQQEHNDSTYNSLKNGMIRDSYIQGLLNTRGSAHERVPLDVMQLFMILQFILSLPNTLQGNQILTPREDVLLKTAISIRGCSAGKKEGIFAAYNLMNERPTTAHSSSEELGRNYLYSTIHHLLSSLLSEDTPLMKALTDTNATSQTQQLSHQATYVKNLIGNKVGLVWDICADQYSYVLLPALVAKKTKDILEIFFRYFSPRVLINEMAARVNRDLSDLNSTNPAKQQKARALYNLLYGLLDDSSCWESDMDENDSLTISLKTEGVIKLLTAFGYLKSNSQITFQAVDEVKKIFFGMERNTGNILAFTKHCQDLAFIDISLQHALFGRMYWHHVKTEKKRVEHLDYGRAAFLETDPRIVVTKEEKREVLRQVLIEYVLNSLRKSLEFDIFLLQKQMTMVLTEMDRSISNRLFKKMFETLQRTGKVGGYDYFGGGEAAFEKEGVLKDEKIAAIDALVPELRAEWLPPEAR